MTGYTPTSASMDTAAASPLTSIVPVEHRTVPDSPMSHPELGDASINSANSLGSTTYSRNSSQRYRHNPYSTGTHDTFVNTVGEPLNYVPSPQVSRRTTGVCSLTNSGENTPNRDMMLPPNATVKVYSNPTSLLLPAPVYQQPHNQNGPSEEIWPGQVDQDQWTTGQHPSLWQQQQQQQYQRHHSIDTPPSVSSSLSNEGEAVLAAASSVAVSFGSTASRSMPTTHSRSSNMSSVSSGGSSYSSRRASITTAAVFNADSFVSELIAEDLDSLVSRRVKRLSPPQLAAVVSFLSARPDIVGDLCREHRGKIVCHVVAALARAQCDAADLLVQVVASNAVDLVTDRVGCVAVARTLEVCTERQSSCIAAALVAAFPTIATDQFGNFAASALISSCSHYPLTFSTLAPVLIDTSVIRNVGATQFGSHVVESICSKLSDQQFLSMLQHWDVTQLTTGWAECPMGNFALQALILRTYQMKSADIEDVTVPSEVLSVIDQLICSRPRGKFTNSFICCLRGKAVRRPSRPSSKTTTSHSHQGQNCKSKQEKQGKSRKMA